LEQNAPAGIGIFFFKHIHFWFMSFICHKPIAGAFGEIALFKGSYQYLQNAHFLLFLMLTFTDAILVIAPNFYINYRFFIIIISLLCFFILEPITL